MAGKCLENRERFTNQPPLIPTFIFNWVSADNGYYVKKSVFIEVTVVPV